MEEPFKSASEAMESLMKCVDNALLEEDSDIALICALPLAKMLELEKASYFSYESPNYNHAVSLVKKAKEFIEKEGVVGWMEDGIEELDKILKELSGEEL